MPAALKSRCMKTCRRRVAVLAFLIAIGSMHMLDKLDLKRWAFLPIVSNEPHQKTRYLIAVHSRNTHNYNLKPLVDIRLLGDVKPTEWRRLDDGIRQNFKSACPSNFILNTYYPVGPLEMIELRLMSIHRHEKELLAIYFDKVIVVDVAKNRKYVFMIDSELKDGENIRCKVADEEDIRGFTHLLSGHLKVSMKDAHPWLSIIQRPLPSTWTRCERLATVTSAIFLAMLVNAMFYGQEPASPRQGLQVGHLFRISWFTFWVSIIGCGIVIPPTVIIGTIFQLVNRRSAEKSVWATVFNIKINEVLDDDDGDYEHITKDDTEEVKRKPFRLPYGFVVLGWILVAASVGLSAFFVTMYSLAWGQEKSLQWLAGMILCLLEDMFAIQILKVVFLSIFNTARMEMPDDGVNLGVLTFSKEGKSNRMAVLKRFRNMAVGIFHHALYVLMFALVIGTAKSSWSYCQVDVIKSLLLVDGVVPVKGSIPDASVIFEYMQKQVIGGVLNGNQLKYGGAFATSSFYDVPNHEVILIGAVRVRQQRVAPRPCQIQNSVVRTMTDRYSWPLTNDTKICTMQYDTVNGFVGLTEQRTFNRSWALPVDTLMTNDGVNLTAFDKAWMYRNTIGAFYMGEQASYPTGGYYVDLPTSLMDALIVTAKLRKRRWIDNATAAIFIDFNIYNPNVNLFTPVKVVFEALSAGGFAYQLRVSPVQLYQYCGANAMVNVAIQTLWIVLLISQIVKMARQVCLQRLTYFRANYWNLVDLLQLTFGVVIIGLFAARFLTSIRTVEEMKSERETLTEMDWLASWEDLMLNLYGFAFFFSMMTFFRHLSVDKYWSVMLGTLTSGRADILSYSALFMLMSVVWAAFFNLLVGDKMWWFSTYKWSFYSLISRFIGGTTSQLTKLGFPDAFSKFWSMVYSSIILYLGGNMFFTIIGRVYGGVNSNVEEETSWDKPLHSYVAEKYNEFMHHLEKPKMEQANQGEDKPFRKPIGDRTYLKLHFLVERFARIMKVTLAFSVKKEKENAVSTAETVREIGGKEVMGEKNKGQQKNSHQVVADVHTSYETWITKQNAPVAERSELGNENDVAITKVIATQAEQTKQMEKEKAEDTIRTFGLGNDRAKEQDHGTNRPSSKPSKRTADDDIEIVEILPMTKVVANASRGSKSKLGVQLSADVRSSYVKDGDKKPPGDPPSKRNSYGKRQESALRVPQPLHPFTPND